MKIGMITTTKGNKMTLEEIITTGPSGFKVLNLDHSEKYECQPVKEICTAALKAGLFVDLSYDEEGTKAVLVILSTIEREPNGD